MWFFYHDLKISYETIGTGDPIIFLHGWNRSKADFYNLSQILKTKYQLIIFDLPSFGDSYTTRCVNLKENANMLMAFIEENNLNNITIISHSYGTRIASILLNKSTNIKRNIIIDGAGINKFNINTKLKIIKYKLLKQLYKLLLKKEKYYSLINNSGSTDFKNASLIQKAMLNESIKHKTIKYLKQIKCETIIFWGQNDQTTPLAMGYKMHRLIKNSYLFVIPNASHFPFLEQENYFNKIICSYLGVDIDV